MPELDEFARNMGFELTFDKSHSFMVHHEDACGQVNDIEKGINGMTYPATEDGIQLFLNDVRKRYDSIFNDPDASRRKYFDAVYKGPLPFVSDELLQRNDFTKDVFLKSLRRHGLTDQEADMIRELMYDDIASSLSGHNVCYYDAEDIFTVDDSYYSLKQLYDRGGGADSRIPEDTESQRNNNLLFLNTERAVEAIANAVHVISMDEGKTKRLNQIMKGCRTPAEVLEFISKKENRNIIFGLANLEIKPVRSARHSHEIKHEISR